MSKNRKAEVEAATKDLDFKTKKYQLVLDTSLGKITLDLLPELAPGHVATSWAWQRSAFTTAWISIASSRAS